MPASKSIGQKRIELRSRLFPEVTMADLWHRKYRTGFTTIPRGLPLIMTLMDKLSKGKPVSSTYFELWCRIFDESFIVLKPREMAVHSGFSGQRAEKTWSERMNILRHLGFIATKPGPEGDLSYAVVFNPYIVLKKIFEKPHSVLDEADKNTLLQRMSEIGADDWDISNPVPWNVEPAPAVAAPAAPATPPPRRTTKGTGVSSSIFSPTRKLVK